MQINLRAYILTQSEISEEIVEIYTTLSLARHIYLSTQFEARQQTTETLLKLCEARLASHLSINF